MSAMESAAQQRLLRRALSTFLTGVTVVTTVDHLGRPRGFTANSFTSVSLDPPLILVCVARNAASFEAFRDSKVVAVSILDEAQRDVAIKFASKDPDKFDAVAWQKGKSGAPLIANSLAWIDCTTHAVNPAGDHIVLLGRVVDYSTRSSRPLGFFQGGFVSFGLDAQAIEQAREESLVVSSIAEFEGKLLLCRTRPDGTWTLPHSDLMPDARSPQKALSRLLHNLGADVDMAFLFSVYDDAARGSLHVSHRGRLLRPLGPCLNPTLEARLFEPEGLPWSELSPGVATMLRRYLSERIAGRFAVYAEYGDKGRLARLDDQPEVWEPDAPACAGPAQAHPSGSTRGRTKEPG